MIEIRVTANDADLCGTTKELLAIRTAIFRLISSKEQSLALEARADAKPHPYDRCLKELRIVRGSGGTRVAIQDEALVVSGAEENLARFASWFNLKRSAASGEHGHYEYIEGNEYIAPDSIPLVVGVR